MKRQNKIGLDDTATECLVTKKNMKSKALATKSTPSPKGREYGYFQYLVFFFNVKCRYYVAIFQTWMTVTVLGTDAAISACRDPRVPEGISGIHGQLVSANFKGPLKLVSYLKFCLNLVFDVQLRDPEIPR